MKIIIFGLTVSSSWGNGHATLWRGLCKAFARAGHHVVFFERDVHYYWSHRDLLELPGGELRIYPNWADVKSYAAAQLRDADVALTTSYCADALAATELMQETGVPLRVFYDLDTPVTLQRLARGEDVNYIGARGLRDYDLVLSYTGGASLTDLQVRLGAPRVEPLYGFVDPEAHYPVSVTPSLSADLSYLGTYAQDRQQALETLFIESARRLRSRQFLVGGAQYPSEIDWPDNVRFMPHVPPADHPAFFCSSRLTLNITREAMRECGYCPSGRLFEAAACGTPIISDSWDGLDDFLTPGREIIIARGAGEVVDAINLPDQELRQIGSLARQRVLAAHTADHRVRQLEHLFSGGRPAARGQLQPSA